MNSIRLRLLKWLIGPILLINFAGASLTYLLAWRPAGPGAHGDILPVLLLAAIFTLALVGLIWFSVTTGLRPLSRLRAALGEREAGELEPLDPGATPHELAPVVAAFNDLLDKVQTSTRAQHDFLADVAHQLRTPLAGLRLQLEWLAQRHAGDAESVRSIGLMLQSNERMIRQTNQLLALARAEPSRFDRTRLDKADLARLIEPAVQTFVEQAGRKDIDIGFDLAGTPVLADVFLLRDLLDNLVDNAVRYTPAGGSVTVRCWQEGAQGILEVEASGAGLAPALRGRVFQRYVRLDEKSAGKGLGLAIVREVADAHGAEIVLDDAPGGGLLVRVRFPAPAAS